MTIVEAYRLIEKNLNAKNEELGFKKIKTEDENILAFEGEKGIYRLVSDPETKILAFECSYDTESESPDYKTISRTLFDTDVIDDRDTKSTANEIIDEISSMFQVKKKVDLEKVKMPKAVSRAQAKKGNLSYDTDSLANRFGVLFPETKNDIKQNIVQYGEFLPETFFMEIGNNLVLDVIKNGDDVQKKKVFKFLNEMYEDGTNEVQDIIAVTILGEMKNDKTMLAVADEYMSEYMSGAVHEVNKLTCKKNKWTKKLQNPPAYKPKKKKTSLLQQSSLS